MEGLPPCLVVEILSRLTDAADLARCRLASRSLNLLSREVRALNIVCTLSRYQKSRLPATAALVTPFKTILRNIILDSPNLESVSIGVEESFGGISYDDVEDESDDLYLNDAKFVEGWLPRVSGGLKFLSVSDFWTQSCYRKSQVLALISSSCNNLVELELKNAWLSVEHLSEMPTLRILTLEFIRLDDENLSKVNHCFPYLQVLNLIGVGGLRDPRICLSRLQTCEWMVSNAPHSLTIIAPSLTTLKLRCVKPRSLELETPLLSALHILLEEAKEFKVADLCHLNTLKLQSSNAFKLISAFPAGSPVKKLTVDLTGLVGSRGTPRLSLCVLIDVFPDINCLTFGPGAWSEMEDCFEVGGWVCQTGSTRLRTLTANLLVRNLEVTVSFICAIVERSPELRDVKLFDNHNVDYDVGSEIMARCTRSNPRVRWRWGV